MILEGVTALTRAQSRKFAKMSGKIVDGYYYLDDSIGDKIAANDEFVLPEGPTNETWYVVDSDHVGVPYNGWFFNPIRRKI